MTETQQFLYDKDLGECQKAIGTVSRTIHSANNREGVIQDQEFLDKLAKLLVDCAGRLHEMKGK